MKTQTRSSVTHKTTVTADAKKDDGGRSLLVELFDDIRSDKRVGKLTAQFGVGGSISSLIFEETEAIAQKEIEVEDKLPRETLSVKKNLASSFNIDISPLFSC